MSTLKVDNIRPYSEDTVDSAAQIGFTPSGTGATARTAQAKLRDVFHIKDFGAVCDGVTDDTTACSNAITAAASGTLIWTGTPLISSSLTILQGLHLFDGRQGINSSTRPGSYILKKSTLNGAAVTVGGPARIVGGGVVAQEGNGNVNITITSNTARWDNGYSENAGTHGWFIDGASNNSNHVTLIHCRSYGNTNHGFYLTGNDANACALLNCFAQANGGDGFFSEKTDSSVTPAWNSYLGCGADGNIGYGIHLKGGTDNQISGGDYEGNTAGDIFIESTEQYATLVAQNRGSVITDNGFYTRRLDRYRNTRGTFHPALRGASGATKTATAITISGTTATITSASHGYSNGDTVLHLAFANGNLNGAFAISNVATDTYDITYRTDAIATVPTSATGLSVAVQKCGASSTAVARYIIEAGVCEVWGQITTSSVTNITGSVQLVLPFAGESIDASLWSVINIGYYDGITHGGSLRSIFQQTSSSRVANIYHDVASEVTAPAQLQGTGLAAVTTIIFQGRFLISSDH
jgi:hypothetical protein